MKALLSGVVSLCALTASMPAIAQVSDGAQSDQPASNAFVGDDIIVTATRRDTTVQTTPVAVTAVSGEALARAGVSDIGDLSKVVPTVQFILSNALPQIYIRGIGLQDTTIGGSPGVATHVNGVYLVRPVSVATAMYDVERVEVLRGPQGTLYGRNATGGVINFITNRPTKEFTANAGIEVGNYSKVRVDGAVSGPVSADIGVRLAGYFDRRDGYTTNLVNGEKIGAPASGGGRFTLEYHPEGSGFTSTLVADYLKATKLAEAVKVRDFYDEVPGPEGEPSVYAWIPGGQYSDNPREVYNDMLDQDGSYYLGGVSLNNVLELGSMTFKSLTAYRSSIKKYRSDVDATDLPNIHYLKNREKSQAFSQEFQLLSNTTGRLEWLVGGFYLHDKATGRDVFDIRTNFNTVADPFVFPYHLDIGNRQTTNAFAAFGQASYEIVENLKATVGLRYSYDRKSATLTQQIPEFGVDSTRNIRGSWKALTPKFGLEYSNGNTLVYASATRGFKAGGFNVSSPAQDTPYDPEFVWTYEVGAKQEWLGRRLTTNIAVFRSDYKDLQVTQYINNTSVLSNAGVARIDGVEFEATARPFAGLTLRGTFAYLDTKYQASDPPFTLRDPVSGQLLDMTGRPLPFAPKYAGSLNLDYQVPVDELNGNLLFNVNQSWRSKAYLDSVTNETESQEGYGVTDGRFGWENSNGNLELAVYARNLFDKLYSNRTLRASSSVGGSLVQYAPPRTYGVQMRVKY